MELSSEVRRQKPVSMSSTCPNRWRWAKSGNTDAHWLVSICIIGEAPQLYNIWAKHWITTRYLSHQHHLSCPMSVKWLFFFFKSQMVFLRATAKSSLVSVWSTVLEHLRLANEGGSLCPCGLNYSNHCIKFSSTNIYHLRIEVILTRAKLFRLGLLHYHQMSLSGGWI